MSDELGNNVRRGLLQTLELLASREEQLQYQRDVPIAYVTGELFCMWDDYSAVASKNREYFSSFFSDAELDAIEKVNATVDEVLRRVGQVDMSIEKFVLTPESDEIAQAATQTLQVFNSENSNAQHST